jgi:hypothetical protein
MRSCIIIPFPYNYISPGYSLTSPHITRACVHITCTGTVFKLYNYMETTPGAAPIPQHMNDVYKRRESYAKHQTVCVCVWVHLP